MGLNHAQEGEKSFYNASKQVHKVRVHEYQYIIFYL